MHVSQIRPLRGWVLVEALEPEETQGGLAVPPEAQSRYPEVGKVIATGRVDEDIQPGDLCIIPNEGSMQGRTYWQACFILLRDNDGSELKVLASLEVEPVVRETVERWRAAPTSPDLRIVVETLDADKVIFNCSDVLDYGLEDLSEPGYRLEYIPAFHIILESREKFRLHYLLNQKEIPIVLRRETDDNIR